MKNMSILIIVATTSFMMMGCGTSGRFLPTTGVYTQSAWQTYTDVQSDVENIVIGKTTNEDLI